MKYPKFFSGTFVCFLLFAGCDVSSDKVHQNVYESKDAVSGYIEEISNLTKEIDLEKVESNIKKEIASNNNENAEKNRDSDFAEEQPLTTPRNPLVPAKPVNVVDGDTIDVNVGLQKERIRLVLVNTPESKGEYEKKPQPFSIEAANFTEMILKDKSIWLEFDIEQKDRYGRTLAYVWLKDLKYTYDGQTYLESEITLNELLLRHGLAHVAVYKPNEMYKEHYYQVEQQAKNHRMGIWK